jgi:hypothetical protein
MLHLEVGTYACIFPGDINIDLPIDHEGLAHVHPDPRAGDLPCRERFIPLDADPFQKVSGLSYTALSVRTQKERFRQKISQKENQHSNLPETISVAFCLNLCQNAFQQFADGVYCF